MIQACGRGRRREYLRAEDRARTVRISCGARRLAYGVPDQWLAVAAIARCDASLDHNDIKAFPMRDLEIYGLPREVLFRSHACITADGLDRTNVTPALIDAMN